MSQTRTRKLVIRSIFGGLYCLSLIDQLFSYTAYESCTHKTISTFNLTLLFWWVKIEKCNEDEGILNVLVAAMIEAVFLLGYHGGYKLECSGHTFESFIPQFYNALILTTLWLDGITVIVLTCVQILLNYCVRILTDLGTRVITRVADQITTGLMNLIMGQSFEKQKKTLAGHVYTKNMHNEGHEDCPVCHLEMKEGKCHHRFHATCLDN